MKLLVRAVLSAACIVSTAVPASACCLWPFGGWWGAGYAPGYGYGPAYPAAGYYAPTVGYYSAGYAGYATSSACCATNCCDPCGSSCGSSCVGTTPSGTLKPSADDKFDRSKYDEELEREREKLRDPDRETDPPVRRREENPDDGFGAGRGMGDAGREPFEANPMEDAKKPPIDNMDPAAEPEPFLENKDNKEPQARRIDTDRVVAHSASMLNSTSGARRLASRSLPSTTKPTSFAGKTSEDKSSNPAPIRWISVPSPEGRARL